MSCIVLVDEQRHIPLQEEPAVRVANWAFNFWAAWPFASRSALERGPAAGAFVLAANEAGVAPSLVCMLGLVVEGVTSGVGDWVAGTAGQLSESGSDGVVLLESSAGVVLVELGPAAVLLEVGSAAGALLPEAKGTVVISVSWDPSAMGPPGLAGQDPGGLTGEVIPKGMVPGAPTANPPTNVFGLTPLNWHWYNPLSSEFLGAFWQ